MTATVHMASPELHETGVDMSENRNSTSDREPEFDGVKIGRPATGRLIDAGDRSLADLPEDLAALRDLHGVGPRAISLLQEARGR